MAAWEVMRALLASSSNLMGDFVEGSGALVLQMTIDRRVVVFGRGRLLPELRTNDDRPTLEKMSSDQQEMQVPGAQQQKQKQSLQLPLHARGQQQQQQPEGRHQSHRGPARGRFGSIASEEEFTMQPVSRWPKNTRLGKAMMDAMVQDLVFGRKARGSSVTAAPTDSASSTPGGAEWVKFKGTSGQTPSSPVPSSSIHSSRHGAGNGQAARGRASWSPTPSTAREDSSSRHSSSRSSAPTASDIETTSGNGVMASQPSKISAGSVTGGASTVKPGGVFNIPTIQVPGSCAEEIMVSREHSGSVDSGSTTTEEAFPADNSGFGSNYLASDDTIRGEGMDSVGLSGGGPGSRGSGATLKTIVTGAINSGGGGDGFGRKSYSRSSSSSSTTRRVSSRDTTTGVLSETEASTHGIGTVGIEDGGVDMEAFTVSQPGSDAVGHQSLYGSSTSPRITSYGSGAGGRAPATTDGTEVEGFTTEGGASGLDEGELAQALADAAQAEAEIEEADAADLEAVRMRTCRIYCDACPKDGVVEFVADRGLRGGGDSWQGLVTAIASEYVQEVRTSDILGLEAVIVSDLPGLMGQGVASEAQAHEGAGHGWGETARSALLMASATFLEEVLEMGQFPRMKALRCFSAALRCRPSPDRKDKSWSGAAPTPFGSEEALRKSDGCGSTGGISRGGGDQARDECAINDSGVNLEELLAIADNDPPGAVLLDSRTRTYCPIQMKSPKDEGIAVVIAQTLDLETAQRLRWQAEQEREKGAAACRAVIALAKEHHPEASCLRDVPEETLLALASNGALHAQTKAASGSAGGATNNDVSRSSNRGGWDQGSSSLGGHPSPTGTGVGSNQWRVGNGARKRLPHEVAGRVRHLSQEARRVKDVAAAFTIGDMDTVVKIMIDSRRSCLLNSSSGRGRQEPAEPAAVRLAQMASRLPGVHTSRQSEGRGSGAAGAVVALVEPDKIEGIMRAINARGVAATGVSWGGFAARPGGGSGITRVVQGDTHTRTHREAACPVVCLER